MDQIQKILIKAGRKDLAQEYYEKVAGDSLENIGRFETHYYGVDKGTEDLAGSSDPRSYKWKNSQSVKRALKVVLPKSEIVMHNKSFATIKGIEKKDLMSSLKRFNKVYGEAFEIVSGKDLIWEIKSGRKAALDLHQLSNYDIMVVEDAKRPMREFLSAMYSNMAADVGGGRNEKKYVSKVLSSSECNSFIKFVIDAAGDYLG